MSDKDSEDLWGDTDEDALAALDFDDNFDSTSPVPEKSTPCSVAVQQTPVQRYRPKYLIVSDFTKQLWCEQQLLYSLDPDLYLLRAPPGEEIKIEESKDTKEVKEKGSDIHLKRELEVQIPVVVTVETKEDTWAVKLLNLQFAVLGFHSGRCVAREIPIFGSPFGCELFVYGIIDEISFDPDTHSLKISELKTRKSYYPPKPAQTRKDSLQVGIYAQLFNDLVCGRTPRNLLADHLQLDLDLPLGKGVQQHMVTTGLSGDGVGTLGQLLDLVLSQMQSLTRIEKAVIEYVHQMSSEQLQVVTVDLASKDTEAQYVHLCEWWKGKRGTTGVEVEECWKCQYCPFNDLCEWRELMAKKLGDDRCC